MGTPSQTKKPVRLVGYRIDGKKYSVATDRYDITAEEVACIYKLRWDIENSLDGGSTTLKSIILLQDRNTGSRYKYSEDLSRTCLLPCIAATIITRKCPSKE